MDLKEICWGGLDWNYMTQDRYKLQAGVNAVQGFGGRPEGKKPTGRPRRGMGLQEVWGEGGVN